MRSIERLINLAGSDPGFYILALHSYIEKYLKTESPVPFISCTTNEFSENMRNLKDHMIQKQNGFNPHLNCFNKLIGEHYMTNQVRHEFQVYSSEEAAASTYLFLKFCRLVEISEESTLKKLEFSLDLWYKRSSRKEEREELCRLNRAINEFQRENKHLHLQVEEWQKQIRQTETLQMELEHVNQALAIISRKEERKSEKNDQLRKERQELILRLRDQENQLSQFRPLIEYSANLKRMVSYTRTRLDYEQSIIRLTSEQKSILKRIRLDKDYRIRGAAGTGKTFLLLEALRKAIGARKESLLDKGSMVLLSYTKTLVKYNRYITRIMNLDSRTDDLISTVDSYMNSLLHKVSPDIRVDYSILMELCKKHNSTDFFNSKQLASELEHYIYRNGISREMYIDRMINRRGMKIALNRGMREIIWEHKELLEDLMLKEGRISKGFSRLLIERSNLKSDVDNFFIDESQDISPLELKILKKNGFQGCYPGWGYRTEYLWNPVSPKRFRASDSGP